MPPAGFQTALPASERPQIYALDCANTAIGLWIDRLGKYRKRTGGRQVVSTFDGAGTADSILC